LSHLPLLTSCWFPAFLAALLLLLLLQAVFAKQKESYINQLMKADEAKTQLQKSVQQLEDQLVRATTEVQQRRQQAADKGEHQDQQLSLLRKVRAPLGCCISPPPCSCFEPPEPTCT
jgi:uncharacterized protein YlxW (UPF0749 family)